MGKCPMEDQNIQKEITGRLKRRDGDGNDPPVVIRPVSRKSSTWL